MQAEATRLVAPSSSGRHLLSGGEPVVHGEPEAVHEERSPQVADSVECRDQFGRVPRYLRISVTGRCNFRCLYCAPESDEPGRPKADALTDGEILRLVGLMVRAGVRKVRFTGGEPLLRHGLPSLMKTVQALPGVQEICISTNAYLLEDHLEALVDAGLSTVNISCDTLREDRFERITRRQGAARVQSAIAASLAHPQIQRVKINMVVMRGINDDEIPDFVRLCDNPKIDVRFIEFMPTAEVAYLRDSLVPEDEVRARIGTPLVPVPLADPSAPARLWSIPGLPGRIGFISTMTHKFCARCDRIRITADGRIANCLFAESLLDLKALLRSAAADAEIVSAVVACWSGKAAGHRLDDPDFLGRPTMIAVGG